MTSEDVLDTINRSAYTRPDAMSMYANLKGAMDGESVILKQLTAQLHGKRLLDIGIGGGRTTELLLDLSTDYTGIDYCEEFIALAAQKFPNSRFLTCDARNMRCFVNSSFDFVLFSFNGLDSIGHEGRLAALREILRVLTKGGMFLFSAHNLNWSGAGKLPLRLGGVWTKARVREALVALIFTARRRRLKKLEVNGDGYAILNDMEHHYSLMLYYVTIPTQVEQLKACGFSRVEVFDYEGRPTSGSDNSVFTYYLAKK